MNRFRNVTFETTLKTLNVIKITRLKRFRKVIFEYFLTLALYKNNQK